MTAGTGSVRRWRRLASAAWSAPSDPQFYGDLEVDASALLAYQQQAKEVGTPVTVTALVGRAVAHGLSEVPELHNPSRIRSGEPTSDVFFIVATEGALSGLKLSDVAGKSAVEVSEELAEEARRVRQGDGPLDRATRTLAALPLPLRRLVLRAGSWMASDLGIDLPALGVARRPFGDAMISSVGMWGVRNAYSPLAAYYRVPLLVLVGGIAPTPVAVDGEVVVRPVLRLTATFDHRYVDGWHAARFAACVADYVGDPGRLEPAAVRAAANVAR
ncbi:2-oxo acid dehydrogenase subunit E2 [Nocardioides panacisoli]|uniref:2-oxo acid dehydrogenase subunit E2 n=1 Tax=Nocardioides panacisoli TaxID=627624 RepID=UPI0031D9E00D